MMYCVVLKNNKIYIKPINEDYCEVSELIEINN
jgi:hypothetical protein